MLFNSYFFILIFLPLAVLGYFGLNRLGRPQYGQYFLLVLSLWFYAANDLRSVPVLLVSIAANFSIGRAILRSPYRRTKTLLTALGILLNLAALGVFKYLNFFLANLTALTGGSFTPIKLLLPLGISFFTFQQISYLVDARKGQAENYTLSEYALFASFFPYIMSGPIAFHAEIIPQLRDPARKRANADHIARGLTAFCFGLFKKVLVADTLGAAANWGWSNLDAINTSSGLVVILSYTLQLYYDFSGYCDMASGIAKMLGIDLPVNFDSPYRATSIADFWKRWHITMTRFFTRYLYIPLGGSRQGLARTCLNTIIIFLVSGLWHGAAWTFILWGALHGAAMVGHRLLAARTERRLPKPLGWLITFVFVNLCWVLFRAPSIQDAGKLLRHVATGFGPLANGLTDCFMTAEFDLLQRFLQAPAESMGLTVSLAFLVLALICAVFPKNVQQRLQNFRPSPALCVGCALMLFWSIFSLSGVSTFLYFTF